MSQGRDGLDLSLSLIDFKSYVFVQILCKQIWVIPSNRISTAGIWIHWSNSSFFFIWGDFDFIQSYWIFY